MLTDGHHLVELQRPCAQRIEGDEAGHELGEAGRIDVGISVLLGEHLAALLIDEYVGGGLDRRRSRGSAQAAGRGECEECERRMPMHETGSLPWSSVE